MVTKPERRKLMTTDDIILHIFYLVTTSSVILSMENDGQKPCQNKPNAAFSSGPKGNFFGKLCQPGTFSVFPAFGQCEPCWSWLEASKKLYRIGFVKFILRIAGLG